MSKYVITFNLIKFFFQLKIAAMTENIFFFNGVSLKQRDISNKGAFTNDVTILGGRGVQHLVCDINECSYI